MNPFVFYRLARYYMKGGMGFWTSVRHAWANQQMSNKYGVKK